MSSVYKKYLLFAFSGFFEDGFHLNVVKSSSTEKNLWYCLEFDRILSNSQPFWINCKQSAAEMWNRNNISKIMHKELQTYFTTVNTKSLVNNSNIHQPFIIFLSSGRALNDTDFDKDRFWGLPSFFKTLAFLGIAMPSNTSSRSSRSSLSPFEVKLSWALEISGVNSAILTAQCRPDAAANSFLLKNNFV